MDDTVRILLDVASQARIEQDGSKLAETIILSPSEPFFHSIQNDLIDNDVEIDPVVLEFFGEDEDKDYAKLYCHLLEYIALVNWDEDGSSSPGDPIREHESLLAVFRFASKIFSQRGSNVSWFIPVLRKISAYLVRSALKADASIGNVYSHKYVEALTRLLHGPYSLAAADSISETEDRRGATFFLANLIFQMYFEIDNIRLCETVMKNLEKQLRRLSQFPRADQTMFHFWRGRILLSQQKIRPALEELSQAFKMCTNQNKVTKRIILLYVVAASLPLGIFPKAALLQEYSLSQQFGPIVKAIKLGNIDLFRTTLNKWRKWFAKRGLWLLLKEKCEVLIWRSLIRRTYLCTQPRNPDGTLIKADLGSEVKEAPPNVSLQDILSALHFSARDTSYTMNDVESMVCSLLDQRYIVGYYHHTHLTLVLRKVTKASSAGGFPPPASIFVQETTELGDTTPAPIPIV